MKGLKELGCSWVDISKDEESQGPLHGMPEPMASLELEDDDIVLC